MIKQVIILRKDLHMRKGKMIAQGAHASLAVILNMMSESKHILSPNSKVVFLERTLNIAAGGPEDIWLNGSFTKICLYVESEEALERIFKIAQEAMLPCSFIVDNGITEFHNIKTPTAVAIGPWYSEEIDKITGDLKLL